MNKIKKEMKKDDIDVNELSDKINKMLITIKDETGIPGICLSMNVKGQKISNNIGTLAIDNTIHMHSEARFQLGCFTKLLTSIIAAELIEAGKLDQYIPIEQYLKELRGTKRGRDLNIRHLLSHTTGYRGINIVDPGVAYYYTWTKFMRFLIATPQHFKPGTVFSYEHSEYAILGEIIERISGQDITNLYREIIIEPLKLTAGTIGKDKNKDEFRVYDHSFNLDNWKFNKIKTIPYCGFWKASLSDITMSINDILKIVTTICGIGDIPNGISERTMKFVQKQVVKLPRTYGSKQKEQIPSTFGVGCAGYRGWLLGHNGSTRGMTIGVRFDPRNNIALAIGMNAWQPYIRDTIMNRIFDALSGQENHIIPEKPFEKLLKDLVGTYIGPMGQEIIVKNEGNQIICILNVQGSQSMPIIMEMDEKGILKVCTDALHYSFGFFSEPESSITGLMLGLYAFIRK